MKLTDLGFPSSIAAASQEQTFPTITFSNYGQWGPPGGDRIRRGNDIHTWVADVTEIHGRHTLNFGGDLRLYNQTPFQGGSPSGAYSFSQSFTQGPNPVASSLTAGDAFASLLTGFGAGSINSVPALAIRNTYWALFLNDEIKMGKLTLNAGLRYDVEEPRTERYNRFATFDFAGAFPIQVPGMSGLRGALTHPGQNGRTSWQLQYHTQELWTEDRLGLSPFAANGFASRLRYLLFSAMGNHERTGVRSLRLRAIRLRGFPASMA